MEATSFALMLTQRIRHVFAVDSHSAIARFFRPRADFGVRQLGKAKCGARLHTTRGHVTLGRTTG